MQGVVSGGTLSRSPAIRPRREAEQAILVQSLPICRDLDSESHAMHIIRTSIYLYLDIAVLTSMGISISSRNADRHEQKKRSGVVPAPNAHHCILPSH